MQQFVVPQFIDVEDRIFGPVTVRQFLILLAAGIIIFLAYRFGDFGLFILVTALVGGSALIVAFVKVNGQTFHYFMLNVLQTMLRPSLRVWNKTMTDPELRESMKVETVDIVEHIRKTARPERMRDLSLIVNTGGYYSGKDDVL